MFDSLISCNSSRWKPMKHLKGHLGLHRSCLLPATWLKQKSSHVMAVVQLNKNSLLRVGWPQFDINVSTFCILLPWNLHVSEVWWHLIVSLVFTRWTRAQRGSCTQQQWLLKFQIHGPPKELVLTIQSLNIKVFKTSKMFQGFHPATWHFVFEHFNGAPGWSSWSRTSSFSSSQWA